jgi:ferredoxin
VVNQEAPDKIKVTIDQSKCIACGACIGVCNHGARFYRDDLARFLKDLENGQSISLIASAATKTNFPNHKRLFDWLRGIGVKDIHDGAVGMELFAWANINYVRRYRPFSLISSHCPVVISYCRTYRPELLPRLSRVHDPITCMAIYVRETEKERGAGESRLGALTSCIAATREFSAVGVISYNITFQKLREYFLKSDIRIFSVPGGEPDPEIGSASPAEPECPDGRPRPEGKAPGGPTLLPAPPTLKENIELNLNSNIRIDSATGRGVYGLLDEYAKTDVNKVPMIFDALYCENGCDLGTAANPENDFFQTRAILNAYERANPEALLREKCEKLFADFDANMDLDKLTRTYADAGQVTEYVSPDALEEAFRLLGKTPDDKRHFDCGFCGSATCAEMAGKIALRTNIPINCVTKMRQVTEDTNKKITSYIELIHNVSEYLLTTVGDDFSASIEHALMSLCYAMDGSSTALWKNSYDNEERPQCHRIVSFPGMLVNRHFNVVTMDDPPGWLESLVEGNSIMRLKSAMSPNEQQKFLGRNVNTLVLSPIIAQGDFWGFISLLKAEETLLTDQDLSVLSVCSNILASFMIKHEFHATFSDLNETPVL